MESGANLINVLSTIAIARSETYISSYENRAERNGYEESHFPVVQHISAHIRQH